MSDCFCEEEVTNPTLFCICREVVTLCSATAAEVYFEEENADGASVSIKGGHLQTRGVDMAKVLYRFSRLANRPVSYRRMTMNSDVLVNELQRGNPTWITRTPESHLIQDFFGTPNGVVTLATLYTVEAENPLLSR